MPKTTSPGRVSQLRLRMPVDSGVEIQLRRWLCSPECKVKVMQIALIAPS
jgi:hypothetical protein